MKDFEHYSPLVVHAAKESLIFTNQGPVIDAIASWWCKSLGHGHPAVQQALLQQAQQFEHVGGAAFTHKTVVKLAQKLSELSGLQHVFFASDGSSAVEIAMKLAIHSNQIMGFPERNEFVALQSSYHGETLGALSVSDLGLYKKPYRGLGAKCHFLTNIPYVFGQTDPLWQDCGDQWPFIEKQLLAVKDRVCGILVEPIIQGAGGMRCYSADFLQRLAHFAQQHQIVFIADEIMTGLGRTGKWLACEHAGIQPDIVCLSKGLTSGSVPFSCVLISNSIYNYFYKDYAQGQSFLHSHTYSGNPLAVTTALATIETMEQLHINERACELGKWLHEAFLNVAKVTGKIDNIRTLGAMVAGDLYNADTSRLGFEVYKKGLQQGVLLRPLGNTLYWLPPLTMDFKTVQDLADSTINTLNAVYAHSN